MSLQKLLQMVSSFVCLYFEALFYRLRVSLTTKSCYTMQYLKKKAVTARWNKTITIKYFFPLWTLSIYYYYWLYAVLLVI